MGGQAPEAKQTEEIETSMETLTAVGASNAPRRSLAEPVARYALQGGGSAKDKRALMTTLFGDKYH
jgi:hypothetical protein